MVCIDILQRIPRARPIFIHAIIFDIDARQQIWVVPQLLVVSEIYAVPDQILSAFVWIELEIHNGVVNLSTQNLVGFRS